MKKYFLIICFLLIFMPLFSIDYIEGEVKDYRAFISKKKQELKEVKKKISSERKKIKKEKYKEKTTTRYLQKLEKEIDFTSKELEVFNNNIDVVEKGINDLEQRIKAYKTEKDVREKQVKDILRAQYKKKNKEYWQLVFRSKNFSEFIKRYKFVKVLSKKNIETIKNYKEAVKALEDDKDALDIYREELTSLKKEKEKQWKQFKNEKWKKHVLLKNIRKNISRRRKMVSQLQKSAKNLNKLMEQMEVTAELADKTAAKAFKNYRHKFPWPVDSKKLLAKFGKYKHPKFKTIVYNRGLHIFSPKGRNVYSIFKGVVKYADWFEGYGKMIIIHHGGGYYSVYSHLHRILVKKGNRVTIKQVIGKSGDTESFYGPELYFEIRQKAKPLNPLNYLRRR